LAERRQKNNIPTYTGAVFLLCHAMLAQYVLLPWLYPSGRLSIRHKQSNG